MVQFDKFIHPMVQYENDLISIFMNVYVNLKNEGKLFKNYKPGEGEGNW